MMKGAPERSAFSFCDRARSFAYTMAANVRRCIMRDLLFNGIAWTDVSLTLNRIAVWTFFLLSGYHKLFNAERHRTFADELRSLGVPALGFNQWWVPSVEFTAGGGVLIGFLTPLAALGLFVIILVSI